MGSSLGSQWHLCLTQLLPFSPQLRWNVSVLTILKPHLTYLMYSGLATVAKLTKIDRY